LSTYAMAGEPGPVVPMPGFAADWQRAVAQRERVVARKFEGMAYPDACPLVVMGADVERVHMFDIPTSLRDHAAKVITPMSGEAWWTIGEFRYAGEDYATAVAQWSRAGVTFGIERDA